MKVGLEHDIDMGLILWHDLSTSHARPFINALSGANVLPEYEQYVRRLASYRRTHKSSLSDPASTKSLIENAAKVSPEFAEEMKTGSEAARRTLDAMVEKYGK